MDAVACRLADSVATLELDYDIPYTSLAFIRQDSGFLARCKIEVQLLDRRGSPIAGDVWQRSISTLEYESTVSQSSSDLGTLQMRLPEDASRARVDVSDLGSDRRSEATFPIKRSSSGLRVRFFKGGQVQPARTYELGDTLVAVAEAAGGEVDSFRFNVLNGKRTLLTAVEPGTESVGWARARLELPIADSSGVARLPDGEHVLAVEARGLGHKLRTEVEFRVQVPFFWNDDAYREKVDELIWVATMDEMDKLKKVSPQERKPAWDEFWRLKDPTPTTGRNEREEEYFDRIEYAKKHFAHGDRGYRSDRARVYVKYGPPESIESRPFEIDQHAYEIWYYYGLGLQFLFVDRSGFGEYVLDNPGTLNGR